MSSIYSSKAVSQHISDVYTPQSSMSPDRDFSPKHANARFSLDSLFSKLEAYQSEIDQMQSGLLKLRKSFSEEEPEIVAEPNYTLQAEPHHDTWDADLDSYGETTAWDNWSEMDSPPALLPQHEPHLSMEIDNLSVRRSYKRSRTVKPLTLNLAPRDLAPTQSQSARLPPRISSKASPVIPTEQPVEYHSVKSHRRCITVSEGRQAERGLLVFCSPDQSPAEMRSFPLPTMSDSTSTAPSINCHSPATPLSLCPPNEDQIRRELEMFALHDGGETLELKYRRRKAPRMPLEDSDDESMQEGIAAESYQDRDFPFDANDTLSITSETPTLRRQKSLFNLFQRKSPVDKLIEMYMDEDQLDKPEPLKRKSTISKRLAAQVQPNRKQVPHVPPVPRIIRVEQNLATA